jgi:hypothetical protein
MSNPHDRRGLLKLLFALPLVLGACAVAQPALADDDDDDDDYDDRRRRRRRSRRRAQNWRHRAHDDWRHLEFRAPPRRHSWRYRDDWFD